MSDDATLGVFSSRIEDWKLDYRSFRNPVKSLRFGIWFKSNPRTFEYMERLFASRFPGGDLVELDSSRLDRASTIVLLYPDSIGLRWMTVERAVFKRKTRDCRVIALNGRGRVFEVSKKTLFGLRVRRALELTMVLEVVFSLILVVFLPFLFCFDFFRGRE